MEGVWEKLRICIHIARKVKFYKCPVKVLHEDSNLICLSKPTYVTFRPTGRKKRYYFDPKEVMLNCGVKENDVKYLKEGFHFPTIFSGFQMYYRTEECLRRFMSLLERDLVKQTYIAATIGEMEMRRGYIDVPISCKQGSHDKKFTLAQEYSNLSGLGFKHIPRTIKSVVTHFDTVGTVQVYGLGHPLTVNVVKLIIYNGFPEQVLVHLANVLRTPVIGDSLYGSHASSNIPSRYSTIKRQAFIDNIMKLPPQIHLYNIKILEKLTSEAKNTSVKCPIPESLEAFIKLVMK